MARSEARVRRISLRVCVPSRRSTHVEAVAGLAASARPGASRDEGDIEVPDVPGEAPEGAAPDTASIAQLMLIGIVALAGWNVALAVLISLAIDGAVIAPVVGVLILAGSNAIFATGLTVLGYLGGLGVEGEN